MGNPNKRRIMMIGPLELYDQYHNGGKGYVSLKMVVTRGRYKQPSRSVFFEFQRSIKDPLELTLTRAVSLSDLKMFMLRNEEWNYIRIDKAPGRKSNLKMERPDIFEWYAKRLGFWERRKTRMFDPNVDYASFGFQEKVVLPKTEAELWIDKPKLKSMHKQTEDNAKEEMLWASKAKPRLDVSGVSRLEEPSETEIDKMVAGMPHYTGPGDTCIHCGFKAHFRFGTCPKCNKSKW